MLYYHSKRLFFVIIYVILIKNQMRRICMKITFKLLSVLLSLSLISVGILGCEKKDVAETVTSQTPETSSETPQNEGASS